MLLDIRKNRICAMTKSIDLPTNLETDFALEIESNEKTNILDFIIKF